ncbi:hypothetical protein NFI96_002521 [Prochilodus magdalenae]|nr:hypothetical protein NFI96_002521 [Prochilodus magdalenae]
MGPMLSKKFIKTQKVVLMGLDSAGKSTLLYKFYRGDVMQTSPTIGFNVVTLEVKKKTTFTLWDVGGQGSMRVNWKYYLEDCEALVFVVDASDRARIGEAKTALKKVLSDNNMTDIPLMVLANKSDLPDVMTISEVAKQLDIESCKDRPIAHRTTTAGIMWVVDHSRHCSDTDMVVVC